jgi:hypothetical protein
VLWLASSPDPAHRALYELTLKVVEDALRAGISVYRASYLAALAATKALIAADEGCDALITKAGQEAVYLYGAEGMARFKAFFGGTTPSALANLPYTKQVQVMLAAFANFDNGAQAPFSEATLALLRHAADTLNAALAESQRADGARAAARARYEAACDEFDRAWTRFAKMMAPLLGDDVAAHLPELGPARPRVSDEDTLEGPAQQG